LHPGNGNSSRLWCKSSGERRPRRGHIYYYDNLLKEKTQDRELLEITEAFNSKEDKDEIGELEDPIFNGSFGKDKRVSFDSDPPSPSVIPTNI
jgi:hypothetical protein